MCAGELDIPADSTVKVIATGTDDRNDKGSGDGPIVDGAAISIVDRGYPGGTPAKIRMVLPVMEAMTKPR